MGNEARGKTLGLWRDIATTGAQDDPLVDSHLLSPVCCVNLITKKIAAEQIDAVNHQVCRNQLYDARSAISFIAVIQTSLFRSFLDGMWWQQKSRHFETEQWYGINSRWFTLVVERSGGSFVIFLSCTHSIRSRSNCANKKCSAACVETQ